MATIYPFRALRPTPELAAKVASVPYDVVDRDEAQRLAAGNPHSFLHVTRAEIDLAPGVDPYSEVVYAQAARALASMRADGVLVQDAKPSLYAYQLVQGSHQQTGVVLCAEVGEYERNLVRKHEHTRPEKETDRTRHIDALAAQSGKVLLCHRDSPAIAREVERATARTPVYDFAASDGVHHRLWVIDDDRVIAAIVDGFAKAGVIYIADGHHRSAAAARYAQARRAQAGGAAGSAQSHGSGDAPGSEEYERFLAVSFPVSQMQILPYNRVVKTLCGESPRGFLNMLRQRFDVSDGRQQPLQRRHFGMYLDRRWYAVGVREGTWNKADPTASLDVSLLQQQILEPLLGIVDPRHDRRIDFVGGIRGDAELEQRVHNGWAVAFKLHPTTMADLLAIADAGQVMPPKSTWFEPKLRDGLVTHTL